MLKKFSFRLVITFIALLFSGGLCSTNAFADDTQAVVNTGDTAWVLASTALVLFMTIPALALFYAGLVRKKNVLSVLMQCLVLTALMSIIWVVCGYTLAFGNPESEALNRYIGDWDAVMMNGIDSASVYVTSGEESQKVVFQPFCLPRSNDFRDHHSGIDGWRIR